LVFSCSGDEVSQVRDELRGRVERGDVPSGRALVPCDEVVLALGDLA